jgi:hypothetical protein
VGDLLLVFVGLYESREELLLLVVAVLADLVAKLLQLRPLFDNRRFLNYINRLISRSQLHSLLFDLQFWAIRESILADLLVLLILRQSFFRHELVVQSKIVRGTVKVIFNLDKVSLNKFVDG